MCSSDLECLVCNEIGLVGLANQISVKTSRNQHPSVKTLSINHKAVEQNSMGGISPHAHTHSRTHTRTHTPPHTDSHMHRNHLTKESLKSNVVIPSSHIRRDSYKGLL